MSHPINDDLWGKVEEAIEKKLNEGMSPERAEEIAGMSLEDATEALAGEPNFPEE